MPHATDLLDVWREALTTAYEQRYDVAQIEPAIRELLSRGKVSSQESVDIILGFRKGDICDRDPLVIRYVELSLRMKLIQPSSLLLGLHRSVNLSRELTAPPSTAPLPTFEEKAFATVRTFVTDKLQPDQLWKIHPLVFAITRWLNAVNDHETAQQLELGPLHTISTRMLSMYEQLGLLAYTIFGHEQFRTVEKQPWWKTRRSAIAAELIKFDANVLQWSHSQMSGHLQALSRVRPFLALDEKDMPIITRDMIMAESDEMPSTPSRGGLFIWMTALLHARPWTDDSTIRNYLLVRYLDDAQNATLHLIVAAFDVLINSMPEQGTPEMQKGVRSFVCNRLPLLLLSLTTAMPAGSMDSCVSMALASIELGPVTPLGTITAEVRETIKKSKLEFLQACVLHELLNEATAAAILSDQTFAAHKHSRLNKNSLLSQCKSNVARLETLSRELDAMSGNVAAAAGCIAEYLVTLCNSRDTMTLKSACAILLKRVGSMESVLQFVAPATALQPLCQVLNEWNHDQEQTEFQPPYEEFAVILLFLAAVVHTLDLDRGDLGLRDNDDFAGNMLFGGAGNTTASELNEEQNKQLASWITGLYATDEAGETTGITDDVYSQCPPQAFYQLVPILFEQTVLACRSQVLTPNAMKGGLEFLLEPFLLPSLLGGLLWLADTTWTDVDDTNIRLNMLDKLMRSSSSSQEVQTMHKTILSIVARPLEASLQLLPQARGDKRKEATKLLELLKPYTAPSSTRKTTQTQLSAWTSVAGGLAASLRSSIRDIATWSNDAGASSRTKHSPLLLWTSEIVMSQGQVLHTLLDELEQQTSTGNGSLAADLCAALICAPNPHTVPSAATDVIELSRIGLIECLRLSIADEHKLLHLRTGQARALVRLSRAVAAQSALSPLASQLDLVNMSLQTQETTEQVMQDLGLDTTANLDAATAAVMNSGFDSASFGLDSTADLGIGKANVQDLNAASSMMSLDQNDDIFGSLNLELGGTGDLLAGGVDGAGGLGTNADDDIFADLDMNGLDGDFEF